MEFGTFLSLEYKDYASLNTMHDIVMHTYGHMLLSLVLHNNNSVKHENYAVYIALQHGATIHLKELSHGFRVHAPLYVII